MYSGGGKLGEYSDKSGSMIGNLAEYSDKTENDVADAASRAEASMQLMEIGIASYSMKNVVLYRSTSGSGNLSEPWLKCFSGEYSDKGVSSQYLRPNIHPIYQAVPPNVAWASWLVVQMS